MSSHSGHVVDFLPTKPKSNLMKLDLPVINSNLPVINCSPWVIDINPLVIDFQIRITRNLSGIFDYPSSSFVCQTTKY